MELVAVDTRAGGRILGSPGATAKEATVGHTLSRRGFMTKAALVAERMDHHPEWSNVYNRVVVDLSTHSEGGITGFDIDLAGKMDKIGVQ